MKRDMLSTLIFLQNKTTFIIKRFRENMQGNKGLVRQTFGTRISLPSCSLWQSDSF